GHGRWAAAAHAERAGEDLPPRRPRPVGGPHFDRRRARLHGDSLHRLRAGRDRADDSGPSVGAEYRGPNGRVARLLHRLCPVRRLHLWVGDGCGRAVLALVGHQWQPARGAGHGRVPLASAPPAQAIVPRSTAWLGSSPATASSRAPSRGLRGPFRVPGAVPAQWAAGPLRPARGWPTVRLRLHEAEPAVTGPRGAGPECRSGGRPARGSRFACRIAVTRSSARARTLA